jgi:hypothetical protein
MILTVPSGKADLNLALNAHLMHFVEMHPEVYWFGICSELKEFLG